MKKYPLIYSMMLILIIPFVSGCEELEDEDPEIDPREAFVGKWNCNDELASGKGSLSFNFLRDNYQVTIEPGDGSNEVQLYNFGAVSNTAAANGSVGGNDINVPFQNLAQGWSCNGSGTLVSPDEIEWTYTLENGSDRYDYIAVFTK